MVASEIEEAIAEGRVPEGITAEYLEESRDAEAIAAIIAVTVLTSLIVFGRLFSRAFLLRRFGLDDYLTLLSWTCFIPFVAICIELIFLGSGRHFAYIQYTLSLPTVNLTQILDFVAHIIYTTALLLCRISGLAFYHRICGLHHKFLLTIKIVCGLLVVGYLLQLFLIIFHCQPVTGLWPYDFQAEFNDYTCLEWGLVYSVNSSVSLICDFLLFGLPVLMLHILEMPRKRKIHLACILLPGVLVTMISITRLVFVIQGQWQEDMSWAYDPMLAIEVSEIGATLIALSVPGVKPLIDKFILRRAVDGDDTKGSSRSTKQSSTGGGTPLHSLNRRTGHTMLTDQQDARWQAAKKQPSSSQLRDDESEDSQSGIL